MSMRNILGRGLAVAVLLCLVACNKEPECPEVAPVAKVRGQVLALLDDAPIAGALVQALDINGAPVGTTGVTDEAGNYILEIPEFVNEEGAMVTQAFTLRVQAQGFQEFPTDIRPALPITTADFLEETETFEVKIECPATVYAIENQLTTVKLIDLPGESATLGSISGNVFGENNTGILVVAEGAESAFSGFSDASGKYTIFNVPAGTYSINGYALGVQLTPTEATLAVSEHVTDVNLNPSSNPLNTVSGSVQIVDPGMGTTTSIVLALQSTFSEASGRGQVPPGLRVGDVSGAFVIEGVPDGAYVVLAAFENDFLVRDPDQNISGTETVVITLPDPVQGNILSISQGFKVTGALAVFSPGADGPEQIDTPTPMLRWEDDSSEDGYEIWVRDAFGNLVWHTEIPGVSGLSEVALEYAGPPLEPGIFYQFRVESFRDRSGGRSPISATEDLKGVFFLLGE